jgi:hypothetical protein
MKPRLVSWSASLVAVFALVAGFCWRSADARLSASMLNDFARLPASREIPRGFTLPATDVNLTVSSLVTADLDADGDLDIVAAERSNGTVGIVVWVNDGEGRLTRKAPAPSTNLAGEPGSPALERHEGTIAVSIQPNGPVAETIALDPRLALPVRSYDALVVSAPLSATPSTLRSRSPPALS